MRDFIDGMIRSALQGRFFVPSLFLCLVTAASVISVCAAVPERRVSAAGAFLFVLAFASLPLIYRNSLGARGGASIARGNAARMALLILLGSLLSAGVSLRVHRLLDGAVIPPGGGEWIARVESVKMRRYHAEAVVVFAEPVRSGESPDPGRFRYRGLARVGGGAPLETGDMIRFRGVPRRVDAATAYGRSLILKGTPCLFYLDGAAVKTVSRGATARQRIRTRLSESCDRLFEEEPSSLIKALYFGNQDYIDKATLNDFKRAGALHLLAASGLHVGIVAAVPFFILGMARVNRKLIFAVAGIVLLGYLCLTDMPVSLFRACLMFFIYAFQRFLDLKANLFNALFIAAAILIALFPGDLFGLGFQLSFGATLGILLFHGRYVKAMPRVPGVIANPLALSLAAQSFVIPIILYRMNELNLAGFFSNIVMVPLVSLIMVASIAAHLLALAASAGTWAGVAVDHVYAILRMVADSASGLGLHLSGETAMRGLPVAVFLIAAPLVPRRLRAVTGLCGAGFALWFFLSVAAEPAPGITALRHGRGLLVLLREASTLSIIGRVPEGRYLERVVREAADASCREVFLHIPHADYENINGYAYLAKRLPVTRCFLSENFRIRGYTRRFFDLLERDRVDLRVVGFGRDGASGIGDPRASRAERAHAVYAVMSSPGGMKEGDGVYDNEAVRLVTLR